MIKGKVDNVVSLCRSRITSHPSVQQLAERLPKYTFGVSELPYIQLFDILVHIFTIIFTKTLLGKTLIVLVRWLNLLYG